MISLFIFPSSSSFFLLSTNVAFVINFVITKLIWIWVIQVSEIPKISFTPITFKLKFWYSIRFLFMFRLIMEKEQCRHVPREMIAALFAPYDNRVFKKKKKIFFSPLNCRKYVNQTECHRTNARIYNHNISSHEQTLKMISSFWMCWI